MCLRVGFAPVGTIKKNLNSLESKRLYPSLIGKAAVTLLVLQDELQRGYTCWLALFAQSRRAAAIIPELLKSLSF